MPPSRTPKSSAAQSAVDAAVYGARPGAKTEPSGHSGTAGATANAPSGSDTAASHASANEQRPKKPFSLFSDDYNQALSDWGHGMMGPDPLRAIREFSRRQTELSHAAAVAPVAPKSPQLEVARPPGPDNFRGGSSVPMKTERQSDQENTSRTAAQDAAAAVYFDAFDFSDDEDLDIHDGPKGRYLARIHDERYWKNHRHEELGHITREIEFKDMLTPEHIDYLIALPKICQRLTAFSFVYHDVDYDATNSCEELTDDDVIRIAHACPKLETFSLPGTCSLTEKSILGMCEHCPELTSLHISGSTKGRTNTGQDEVFRALTEHPEWAPKLKVLRVADNVPNNKALRVLSQARPKLQIALVNVNEEKQWDSWYLVKNETKWRGNKRFWGNDED